MNWSRRPLVGRPPNKPGMWRRVLVTARFYQEMTANPDRRIPFVLRDPS